MSDESIRTREDGWYAERIQAREDAWYAERFNPPVPEPCRECPWRRDSQPGHLGPHTPREWVETAHGEAAVACHMTIVKVDEQGMGSWDNPGMRQCKGIAIFRGNVCKTPRRKQVADGIEEDTRTIFGTNAEFITHHEQID